MAGRFASLSDADLEQIIQDKDAKSTKSVIRVAENILADYLKEKNGEFKTLEDLREVDHGVLNSLLRQFYGEVRKADGNMYAYKSMQTIRFGLQKHFLQSRDIDIINCDTFATANAMFKAVMVKLSKLGLGTTTHKDVIVPEDLEKLYNHDKFSRNTPDSLQKRTFFEYLYYFCNRGRENLREVHKDDFILGRDGQGRKFVTLRIKRQTKNHRGDNLSDVDHKDGKMYEMPGDENCPVTTFTKYMSKLNPLNPNFWQRSKSASNISATDEIWYDNVAVGKNTLGNMMAKISIECELSKRYTNHCIRSTCITALDDAGIDTRHIMGLSGHKSEKALKSYSHRLSENKKRQMSEVLSTAIKGVNEHEAPLPKKSSIETVVPSNSDELITPQLSEIPDFLSDDFNLANVLNDISNFKAGQISVQNNSHTVTVTNSPTLNTFRIPGIKSTSGLTISSINNCTVNFNFHH